MKGWTFLLSFLVVLACVSETNALELQEAKWLHQAASDNGDILGQDIAGENALNIYIVSDTHVSWSELLEYAEKESDYFLESVPCKELYNIIVVQADDLGFYVFGQEGYPARTVRPIITSIINREYSQNEFLAYVNGFSNVLGVRTSGYDEPLEPDGLDGSYVSVSLRSVATGIVAHELGHLIADLADEYFALGTGRNWQLNYLTQNDGSVNKVNLYGDLNYISTGEIQNGEVINVNIVDIPKSRIPWAPLIDDGTPLPTFRSTQISFGELLFVSEIIWNNTIGAFGYSNILFAPTSGKCIMDNPGTKHGYCEVCKHAFTVQALTRTREVEISNQTQEIVLPKLETMSPSTTKPLLSISLFETGNDYSISWLVNGVTDESISNKTTWTDLELHGLIGKTLTLRVTNETAKEYLVYNPYNLDRGYVIEVYNPSGTLASIYTEEYEWQIKEVVLPTATPTPLPPTPTQTHTPTNTPTLIPTPTPAQVISVSVTPDSKQFGVYTVLWQWPKAAQDPKSFEVHVYQGNIFISRVDPAPLGNSRSVDITLDEPGMYTVFVAAVFDRVPSGTDFKPSSIEVLPTPTPRIPTSVDDWWMH